MYSMTQNLMKYKCNVNRYWIHSSLGSCYIFSFIQYYKYICFYRGGCEILILSKNTQIKDLWARPPSSCHRQESQPWGGGCDWPKATHQRDRGTASFHSDHAKCWWHWGATGSHALPLQALEGQCGTFSWSWGCAHRWPRCCTSRVMLSRSSRHVQDSSLEL